MNKGILVVVSGFSGAGKGTVMKRLMEKYDVMHYLSPQQPENPVPVKRTAENISSVQGMNLRS